MAWNGDTSGGAPSSSKYTVGHPHARRAGERSHQAGLAGDVAVADRLEPGRRHLQHDALTVDGPAGRRAR